MATKTKIEDIKEETTEEVKDDAYWAEKVPLTIPFDRYDNNDLWICVNGNAYQIKRGTEVMVPRNVKQVWEDLQAAEMEAYMRSRRLQEEFQQGLEKL